jgi:hypothetical protein
MRINIKTVVSHACSFSITVAIGVAFHFLWAKPTYEYAEYKSHKISEVLAEFDAASNGDEKAIRKLEQLSHEDSGWATYAMLMGIYKNQAIAASGIDLSNPDANLDLVDPSRTDDLLLQAMREENDIELYSLLYVKRGMFDDEEKKRTEDNVAELGQKIINRTKIDNKSTLSQETRDSLLACYKTLDEKFSHPFNRVLDVRAIGACSKNPPNGSFIRMMKEAYGIKTDQPKIIRP